MMNLFCHPKRQRRILFYIIFGFFGLLALRMTTGAYAQTALPPECVAVRQADKGADYIPGVDVKGRAVVPADVGAGGASPFVPYPVIIPVTIDLAERVGLSVRGLELSGTMGFLEVFGDGRVLYNGQDLTQKVKNSCAVGPATAPDGQPVEDAIEYDIIEDIYYND